MSPDSASLRGNAANVTLLVRQPDSRKYYKKGGLGWALVAARYQVDVFLIFFLLLSALTRLDIPHHHPSRTTPTLPPRQDGSAGAAAERGEDRRRQALRRRTRNLIHRHQLGLVAPRGSVTPASERECVTNQVVTAGTERARTESGKVSCASGAAAASITVTPQLQPQNLLGIFIFF